MKIIDLTQPLHNDMLYFDGDKPFCAKTQRIDDFTISEVSMSVHNGTHLDVFQHFTADRRNVQDFSLQDFVFSAWVFDVRDQLVIDVIDGLDRIHPGDAVLFYTGHAQYFKEKKYYQAYPVVSEKLVRELIDRGVKLIGLDTPSPDKAPYEMHRLLFDNEVFVVENLCRLEVLPQATKLQLFIVPLPLPTEASPVRAFVMV